MAGSHLASRLRARVHGWRAERRLGPIARQVRREHLTYLQPTRLAALEQCARRVNAAGVQGDFVECGVALGGSAVVLADAMADRRLHAYDVFGMIPPPGDADPPEVHERYAVIASGRSSGIDGDTYYGYRNDLEQHVARTLGRFGHPVGERVFLYKGSFDETLHPDGPVSLAHIDCDWHDPVDVCLRRIGPQLSVGGMMILDDYHDYGGCRTAADRFLSEHAAFAVMPLGDTVAITRTTQG